jgi:hypothetical protein
MIAGHQRGNNANQHEVRKEEQLAFVPTKPLLLLLLERLDAGWCPWLLHDDRRWQRPG